MGINREFKRSSSTATKMDAGAVKLRVMSFNVLAHGLSADSFVRCPAEALQLEKRLDGIVEEIVKYSADVVCLQEVDMYEQLKARLPDYTSVWNPKPGSPCLNFEHNIGPDGSAIFFKSSSVSVLSGLAMPLQMEGVDTNQILLYTQVKLTNGHKLLILCLHLKAKPEFSKVRQHQGQFVLDFIKSNCTDSDSVIIAGDLNSIPTEAVHKLIESSGYTSSYVAVTGAHPDYTTCKIRCVNGAETTQCKVEDYIYYKNISSTKQLCAETVLEVPVESALGEGRLPNMDYPSDHLSIVADFIAT